MAILSFQSRVVWGHVGNSVAEFTLRRMGVNVWPIDTVCLSHHPGHGAPRGRTRGAQDLNDLVRGLAEMDVLYGLDAVLSGYLGSRANGEVVLRAAAAVKAQRPPAIYCCDPVMGDRDTGLYVEKELVSFFRDEALPAADIITPNHFELETLVGTPLPTLAEVLAAADQLRAQGPSLLLVSSLALDGQMQEMQTLLVAPEGAWLASTPRLALRAHGAGDLLAALFLARKLRGEEPAACLAGGVAATFAVLEVTADALELQLVAAQEAMVHARPGSVTLRRLR